VPNSTNSTSSTNSSATVTIDVWADLGCPWCYIGSRRLALALAHEPDGCVVTRWRSFQLKPDSTLVDVAATEVGREVGISFDFKRQVKVADTALAQQAILLYDGEARQRAVAASLYGAYFERGLDISDLGVVAEAVAGAADDEPARIRTRIEAGASLDRLEADAIEARLMGISAVPMYVAAGRVAVHGAQEVEVLRSFLAQARELVTAG